MSVILGPDGQPVPEAERPGREDCPRCGAGWTERQTIKGFGGYWTRVCVKCGHATARGRGEPPPED